VGIGLLPWFLALVLMSRFWRAFTIITRIGKKMLGNLNTDYSVVKLNYRYKIMLKALLKFLGAEARFFNKSEVS